MNTFAMMVGIAGSGKDTFIKSEHLFDDYVVVSTDQIRKDNGYPQGTKKDVFKICHEQIISSLSLGKNVVFNATNLGRKYRMAFLNELHKIFKDSICYDCYVILTPVKVCKMFNAKRTGFDRVPEEVIDNMAKSFEIPLETEGFNNVYFCDPFWSEYCNKDGKIKPIYLSVKIDEIYNFNQQNPHHTLSLGEHMDAVCDYIFYHYKQVPNLIRDSIEYKNLCNAALYHDIGKMITKVFHDTKGNPTKTAHYYGHENAGAYIVLSEFPHIFNDYYSFDSFKKIATYINFHMRASFVWNRFPDGKGFKRDQNLLSEFDIACLKLLGEGDRYAH